MKKIIKALFCVIIVFVLITINYTKVNAETIPEENTGEELEKFDDTQKIYECIDKDGKTVYFYLKDNKVYYSLDKINVLKSDFVKKEQFLQLKFDETTFCYFEINEEAQTFTHLSEYDNKPDFPMLKVELPCKVVIKTNEYGDVLTDILEGNVGDIVTVYAKGNLFCRIKSLKVNGVDLVKNEDGNYQFALVLGENTINAEFEINNEDIKRIATLIDGVKETGIDNLFTMKNLMLLLGYVINAVIASGFFVTWIKTKKIKTETQEDIMKTVKDIIEKENAKAVKEFLLDILKPIFDNLDMKLESVEELTSTLTKCFILSQEGTPESRLAIIEELTKNQKKNAELSEEVKKIIAEEIAKKDEKEKKKAETIKELEEANKKIVESEKTETDKKDIEGRY